MLVKRITKKLSKKKLAPDAFASEAEGFYFPTTRKVLPSSGASVMQTTKDTE